MTVKQPGGKPIRSISDRVSRLLTAWLSKIGLLDFVGSCFQLQETCVFSWTSKWTTVEIWFAVQQRKLLPCKGYSQKWQTMAKQFKAALTQSQQELGKKLTDWRLWNQVLQKLSHIRTTVLEVILVDLIAAIDIPFHWATTQWLSNC